jgi:hypothetical protein
MSIVRSIVLVAVMSQVARAQDVCKPGSGSNEAKMMAFFAAPIAFSPSGNVGVLRSGEIRLSFDVTYVPSPSEKITRPEDCYSNEKTENTELSPVFPRPRVAIGLGGGFAVEAMYLPPITVLDATPNLVSLALSYTRSLTSSVALGVRGHTTLGQVGGPITCSKDVIQSNQPAGNCYAFKPSDDTYKPNMVGGEAMLSFGTRESKFSTYVGAGVTALSPEFEVGYIDALNNVDNTRLEVSLTRLAAFAGGAYRVVPRFALTGELYSVPEDVTTVRFGGSFTLRSGK